MTIPASGDLALINAGLDPGANQWTLGNRLLGGHDEIVRCVLWNPRVSNNRQPSVFESSSIDSARKKQLIITGGEDGAITLWSGSSASEEEVHEPSSRKRPLEQEDSELVKPFPRSQGPRLTVRIA